MRIPHALAGVSWLLLAACTTGDFGEPRSLAGVEAYNYDYKPSIFDSGAFAGPVGERNFEFTDDERLLRQLAYPLAEPGYDRHQWDNVGAEGGIIESGRISAYDRTAYAAVLLSPRYRSPASRYAQLIDDIRNDSTRMPQFFETAARVIDIDRKRQKSFAFLSSLSPAERSHAQRRIHENIAITRMVHASLQRRASAYGFALERLVLMTPSTQAVDVEHALNRLKTQIARYRFGAPPVQDRIAIAR